MLLLDEIFKPITVSTWSWVAICSPKRKSPDL